MCLSEAGRPFDGKRLRRFVLEDGWVVWVGRTERDNDYLSLKLRQPADLWFHAAGCAGAHALLLHREGQEPPSTVVRAAASIAAYYSKARAARQTSVHVTPARNVSKRRGAPAGEVMIQRERSLKVPPALPADRAPED